MKSRAVSHNKHSLLEIFYYALRESIRGAKSQSIGRYCVAMLSTAFNFAEFGGIAVIVNEFSTHGISTPRIGIIMGGLAMIVIADFFPAILNSLQNYFWETQHDRMSIHMQTMIADKLRELDIGTIEQAWFQDLYHHATNRGWGSVNAALNLGTNIVRSVTLAVIATISLVVISPLILLIIVLGGIPTYFINRKNATLTAQSWQEGAELQRSWKAKVLPLDEKNSLIELKNFDLISVFKKKFISIITGFHTRLEHIYRQGVRMEIMGRIILTLSFASSFVILIHNTMTGLIAIGSLVFSFSVISRFQGSINTLFDSFGRLAEHRENISKFMQLMNTPSAIISGDRIIDPSQPITVELKKVCFAYPGSDRRVLNNISLSFKTGDNIAIVGLNGAGKTTLIKLLTRVYDPTSGEILVNGVPLREYDLKYWKRCLGILLQEYSMYSEETIAENIMLGDVSKHDDHLVEQAARETTAHEFISELPERYQQRVGTEFRGGVELSKGQKQKIALARVLYRNAPIVILDEPTASVDALSEDVIFKNLKSKHTNQSRIIISHKFSNVRDADQIILIQDGTILEQGSHDELMKQANGKYRELFELQAEGYR